MNVENLVKTIKLRPEMFIGTPSLKALFYFISGYLYNLIESNRADDIDKRFKNDFHFWVKDRLEREYSIDLDEQRNYVFYIQQITKNDEEQIDEFFRLCDEFFNEQSKIK